MKTKAFHLVNDYVEARPEPQQSIAEKLREHLFELVPNIEERFSYRLPFYHYHGMLCYLRAADGVVYICFCRGKDLVDAFPELEQKQRATICCVKIETLKDIVAKEITSLITTAAEWNKEAAQQKIPMLQRKKKLND